MCGDCRSNCQPACRPVCQPVCQPPVVVAYRAAPMCYPYWNNNCGGGGGWNNNCGGGQYYNYGGQYYGGRGGCC